MRQCAPARPAEQFKSLQPKVQPELVAPVFDDVASVRNRGAVAIERGPLVYALETATAAERRAVEAVLRDRNYEQTPFAGVLAMVERCGGVQRTRERAAHFTERARQIVTQFPESPYQRALFTLTELVTDRDR